jgi:outer membrane murein-binding lipoprotein Lpp
MEGSDCDYEQELDKLCDYYLLEDEQVEIEEESPASSSEPVIETSKKKKKKKTPQQRKQKFDNVDWNARSKDLDEELQHYKQQVASLTTDNKLLRNSLQAAKSEGQQLQEKANKLKVVLNTLYASGARQADRIASSIIEDMRGKIRDLERDKETLRERIRALESSLQVPEEARHEAYVRAETLLHLIMPRIPPPINCTECHQFKKAYVDMSTKYNNLKQEKPESYTTSGEPKAAAECVICAEVKTVVVLVPCGHAKLCHDCAAEICSHDKKECPLCRTHIEAYVSIYQ